jgi:predicted rRNA methylase YqxC with S4 and FtsJ domains
VVAAVEAALAGSGLEVLGTVPSPILGPAGNREFLTAARR